MVASLRRKWVPARAAAQLESSGPASTEHGGPGLLFESRRETDVQFLLRHEALEPGRANHRYCLVGAANLAFPTLVHLQIHLRFGFRRRSVAWLDVPRLTSLLGDRG